MAESRYITTTLPYVNADPHIGFAYEIIQADALARYWRGLGHDVFFTTGTDEHGQKIFQVAVANGQDVQAYVDHYAGEFNKLKEALGLSYDAFIRTTDEKHIRAAQELWKRCLLKGDIEKRTYKGLYCVGDEMFLKEGDLVDGKCPNHPAQDPVEIEEENYFFKLSNYQDQILAYLEQPDSILPEWRRQEAIAFVKNGLEDFSISREKARMSWGIPVPDDEGQVMYVWFDALTNYISTLGWPDEAGDFKKFWVDGVTLQVAGKDQVRFQSIMWQGMLMSAGVPATQHVLYHGFITVDGQKMSKSIGNVIHPFDLVEKYGTDATRYLLLRHVHPFEDTDITWGRLDEWYTANLVNGLGNLTARILKMSETHGVVCEDIPAHVLTEESVKDYNVSACMDDIWKQIQMMDEDIQKKEPFKKIKTAPLEAREDIHDLLARLARVAVQLAPFLPQTSSIILDAIRANKKPENLFPRIV